LKLSYLLKDCAPLWRRSLVPAFDPGADPDISSIHNDSRDVKPGGLFIAVKGFKTDGHDYIDDAFKRGAAAVVTQEQIPGRQRIVEVSDTRRAMASIAARFYSEPSLTLCLIGITGTNGKTTTAFILESILSRAGHSVGVIGTVNYRYMGKSYDNSVTTPEAIDLQGILSRMKSAGVTHVIMEVSSHGIDLHRVKNSYFDVGVFTNLTQEHLDYHRTMGRYFACKRRFFTRLLTSGPKAPRAAAVINLDDPRGQALSDALTYRVVTTAKNTSADISTADLSQSITGTTGTLKIEGKPYPFTSALTGSFNLENILSAAGAAHSIGIDPLAIIAGIEECRGVPGRLERVEPAFGRHVFVDYAHTPDALASILKALRAQAAGRIITVVGCGGDRDRSKRPIMAEIAVTLSDLVIITSDNPRSEDPQAIIRDMVKGIDTDLHAGLGLESGSEPGSKSGSDDFNGHKAFHVESDRRKALERAVLASNPGDILVAAGKGHENYQILKGGTIHFDDREVLLEALAHLYKSGEES